MCAHRVIRVGLLGAGLIGTTHAQAYGTLEQARLVAVADMRYEAAQRLAQCYGARAYDNAERLLDDGEVDVVDICLPNFLHAPYFVAAAERGKHILCEKPVALTLEEVDQMRRAAQRAGVIAMVAQVIRFWPQYVTIRELLQCGELGQPLIVTAARLGAAPAWGTWFADPKLSGGAVLDLHIHDLDFIYSLFGRPRSIYAVGVQSVAGAWNHVITSLDFGATKATVEASLMMPTSFPFRMVFRVVGTRACIEFQLGGAPQIDQRDRAVGELVLYRADAPPIFPAYSNEDAYRAEIRYFIECVAAGRPPEQATLDEARAALEIALAARRSLETGQIVYL